MFPKNLKLNEVVASLPGIFDVESNIESVGEIYPPQKLRIFFKVSTKNNSGLFLLTRCCDSRYFHRNWKIELCVGDQFIDNIFPINYMLESGSIGYNAIKESYDLIENINDHLNHIIFMEGYNLKKEDFFRSYIQYQRKNKLLKINAKLYKSTI